MMPALNVDSLQGLLLQGALDHIQAQADLGAFKMDRVKPVSRQLGLFCGIPDVWLYESTESFTSQPGRQFPNTPQLPKKGN